MNKPVGVIIIAILQFLGAAFCILGGIAMILGGGMLGALLSQNSQVSGSGLSTVLASLGIVAAVVLFVFAGIAALVGWGMWSLKNWARIVTIVLCGIGICFGGIGLLFSLLHFHIVSIFFIGIRLAINGLIIWYLLQPHVRMAFEGKPLAATA